MAAPASKHPEEPAEDAIHRCDSDPPPAGEEGYGKPTEVRAMPANLLELLKKSEIEGAMDAELADVADLANLILSSRAPTTPVPSSGIVPKREFEAEAETEIIEAEKAQDADEDEVPIAPPPARLPRTEIPPPATLTPFNNMSSSLMFAGVVFGLTIAWIVAMVLMRGH
jgi:hypothetical protein